MPELDAPEGQRLLRLAMSRPQLAVERCEGLLGHRLDRGSASYAFQALAIAYRELGDGAAALRYTRRALSAARRVGSRERIADVRATLGSTLAMSGRFPEALAELEAALPETTGVDAARILLRRGGVLSMMGRQDEALDDLRAAIPSLRANGDAVYEARALGWRASLYHERGDFARADRDLARGEQLLRAAGQQLESVWVRHNRGCFAARAGNLPRAFSHFDAAEALYAEVGHLDAELELDRCRASLAAGMPDDARRHAQRAADRLVDHSAWANTLAETLLTAASAALAAGDYPAARSAAVSAARLFRKQGRERWWLRARRSELTARFLGGQGSASMQRSSIEVAVGLDAVGDPETTEARLLAGRIALRRGDPSLAQEQLSKAALARSRGSAVLRATGWLAKALQAETAGDSRGLVMACRRGLEVLDEHRYTFGATEMRARATVHGAELAQLATRHAAGRHNAAHLLQSSERWRATTLIAAPVRPPDDDELARDLSTLRDVTTRLSTARAEGLPTTTLEREQARLEVSVRRRMLRTSGDGPGNRTEKLDLAQLRAALGNTTLLELVEVDGTLHVVTVTSRRTQMHTVGRVDAALSELEFALFALRRIAAATSPALVRASARSLGAAATSLEKALLGPVVDRLGDGPVLVVPSGKLHAVPWSLLTSLRDREVTVAPSATSWLRAKAMQPPRRHKVTLVVGPGLETGGAEVAKVAGFYPDARLLDGAAATADDVLDALNGASLAHIAAHGTFRADNALFSSLRLADGPLTVHDLERLRRPPHRLLLSSCDSGLGEVAGADELLGLSSALIGMGSAGLLASVVQVNDPATVPLMVAVHEQLQHGATLAQALHKARVSLGDDDPVLTATGQSFIALGAA